MHSRFTSLYFKISVVLLFTLFVLAVAQAAIIAFSWSRFFDESEQLNHWRLAHEFAKELDPILNPTIDYEQLEDWLKQSSLRYPKFNVFLLNEIGVVQFSRHYFSSSGTHTIDLSPVRKFLKDELNQQLPLYGQNPLELGKKTIFSASPTKIGGVRGYLYVTLSGAKDKSLGSLLEIAYVLKVLGFSLGSSVLLATIIGLLAFFVLTRRFEAVTSVVRSYQRGNFSQRIKVSSNDEIGELGRSINTMAERIVESIKEIEKKDEIRKELIANVSHDLRGPIASIKIYLDTLTLEGEALDPDHRNKCYTVIDKNLHGLEAMIYELFDLSRLEAREVSLSLSSCELDELIRAIHLKFAPVAENANLTFKLHTPESNCRVRCDVKLIERTISNLVENAIRYSGDSGEVNLGLSDDGDKATISVSDTGIGIPAEDIPHVFERYFRTDAGKKHKTGGTGLGLAIVKQIVELHGSKVEVESALGKGTVFKFALPKLDKAPSKA